MYHAYQVQDDMLWPARTLAQAALPVLNDDRLPAGNHGWVRKLSATCDVVALARLTHRRPDFAITRTTVGDREVAVREVAALTTPFCTLLHLKKDMAIQQPRVLIVAPMSGHFATLLRDTARTMLPDHDVYITDWHNARDVPVLAGRFGLDEYIEHLMTFLSAMGGRSHLMAICQPCVPALAATALMEANNHPDRPFSLTLMAGPIDCRISPTEVNRLATAHDIHWFEQNLVSIVPLRFRGALRRVYPGFLQLTAFMNMNLERHMDAFRGYYADLVAGNSERAAATRAFYEEYFAVADLPAEFYIDTVRDVFQQYKLPKGELMFRDEPVDTAAIRRTPLLTAEGERDDICSLGQTLAAHDLCTGLRPYMKSHYIQAGVGHYGVFSGKRWQNQIYPIVREAMHVAEASA